VVTTLHKNVQHVILIGDHKQLKPSTAVYELTTDYKLDVSLFERLVNNRLPHVTLAVQHRMQPEVARLVRHVYPELKDHATTENRPRIRGVSQNVFLFHHEVGVKTCG
jgi:superfamily I DNA and/or RNA helicase